MSLHQLAEARSLEYHRRVAERLRSDPAVLERALARVRGWLLVAQPSPEYARAWLEVLERPVEEIAAFLVDDSERARALRQVTPFAGEIDPRERWRIWRRVRERFEGAP